MPVLPPYETAVEPAGQIGGPLSIREPSAIVTQKPPSTPVCVPEGQQPNMNGAYPLLVEDAPAGHPMGGPKQNEASTSFKS
jgi:hypothetical protein